MATPLGGPRGPETTSDGPEFRARSRTPSGGPFWSPRAEGGTFWSSPGSRGAQKRINFRMDFPVFSRFFPFPRQKPEKLTKVCHGYTIVRVRTSRFGTQNGVRRPPRAPRNRSRERVGDEQERARTPERPWSAIGIPTLRFSTFFRPSGDPGFSSKRRPMDLDTNSGSPRAPPGGPGGSR